MKFKKMGIPEAILSARDFADQCLMPASNDDEQKKKKLRSRS